VPRRSVWSRKLLDRQRGSACSRASALLVEKGGSHGPRFLSKSRHGCPLRPARFGAPPPARRHDAPMDSRVARRVHRGGGAGHTHCFGERPPSVRSDAVTEWNANAGDAAVAACISPIQNPLHESRMDAMTHVAIHDALNAIDRRSRPYAFSARVRRRASADAAVAAVHAKCWSRCSASCPHRRSASPRASRASGLRDGARRHFRTVAPRRAGSRSEWPPPRPSSPGEPRMVRTRRCRTSPTHGARLPASTASHPGSTLRSQRAGPTSPRSCCETARSSAHVRPTR
jgi:hypothetical protein